VKPTPSPESAPSVAAAATRWPGAAIAVLAVAALAVAASRVSFVRVADLALLDTQFAFLARHAPIPARDGIAVVGLDEATLAANPAPIALAHRTLARTLAALADAHPRAVGVDLVLPERSYDALTPGADAALVASLLALKRVAPVVIGLSTRADDTLRPVHPPFLAAATTSGLALLPLDDDGRVRRYDDRFGAEGESVPMFVGQLARTLGVAPGRGLLQYALGDGFDYVPIVRVLDLADANRRADLSALFRDRTVLIGAVLPHDDRLRQPVRLAKWEDTQDAPGVLVHAQALRTMLAGATVTPLPALAGFALVLAGAALWAIDGIRRRTLMLALFVAAAAGASLVALRGGVLLPLGDMMRAAAAAYVLRGALDLLRTRRDRARLTALFGGYVSPGVLREIVAGRLDARHAERRSLAFLFADVRDFTALSERTPPTDVLRLLNRYFDAMAPAIHREGGTIDNFRGDGLMAVFGAPNAIARPANAAVAAARAMFAALASLNQALAHEGRAPLAIGVSLAYGDAVVGNVGARNRYNYTALGDAANVAARLQEITKTSGYPLVATAALVAAADGAAAEGWTSLGAIAVRGHGAVDACGTMPG
jgi:class 3 adenylate cyclase/CHASE2 domain-containing sensor protein